jgi:hypothetical protein
VLFFVPLIEVLLYLIHVPRIRASSIRKVQLLGWGAFGELGFGEGKVG